MSELQTHECRVYDYGCREEMVSKHEVSKMIEELEESHKKEVEQLLILNREQAIAANRLRDSMEQGIRSQKYKRSLLYAKNHALEARKAQSIIRILPLLDSNSFTKKERDDFAAYWARVRDNHVKYSSKWMKYAEYFKEKAEEH